MGERVERFWRLPETILEDRGGLGFAGFAENAGGVQQLWPGIRDGRSRPEFAYPITIAEYLVREKANEHKHEFVDGFVYAMAGASSAHATITGNLEVAIRPLLRGSGCRAYGTDMKLAMPDVPRPLVGTKGTFYYPDYMVTCSKADREPSADEIKREPCLVIEVLSPSTATVDRTEKLDRYRQIRSLEQYWLVDQKRRRIVVFERDGSGWRETEYTSPGSRLLLPIEGLEIRLEDVYVEVFEDHPD